MGINPKFWENKKVLLTGHSGFKGSWLSIWLKSLGAEVCGVSLDTPSTPSLFEKANVASGMKSIRADIRELDNMRSIFKEFRPSIVLHMAAQSLVRKSYREPVETYSTNVMGTLNILESMRAVDSVRAAVMVTTDKCYENKERDEGYREGEALGGFDPYSSSKACAELVSASYRNSFLAEHTTAVASVRAGNVIGGGDWAEDRLIPDLVRGFENRQVVKVRNRDSIRPWQHVLDPLHGYLMLAEKLYSGDTRFAKAWNFGPAESDAKPVGWIVDEMANLWGDGAAWEQGSRTQPHEAKYLKLDCTQARTELEWAPRWGLATGLRKIVQWHKNVSRGESAEMMCQKQIQEFMA